MTLGCLRFGYVGCVGLSLVTLVCIVLGSLKLGYVGLRCVVLRYAALVCVGLC